MYILLVVLTTSSTYIKKKSSREVVGLKAQRPARNVVLCPRRPRPLLQSRKTQRRRGCKLKAADASLPSWWPPRPATFSLLHALRLGEISELPELGTLSLQAYDSQDEFFFMYVELIVSTTSTICNIDILCDHISTSYNLQIAFMCLSGTFFLKISLFSTQN